MLLDKLCTNMHAPWSAAARPLGHFGAVLVVLAGGMVSAAERPLAGTGVSLPALAEPGMADEMIFVNFDQVDIRVMLKTICA